MVKNHQGYLFTLHGAVKFHPPGPGSPDFTTFNPFTAQVIPIHPSIIQNFGFGGNTMGIQEDSRFIGG